VSVHKLLSDLSNEEKFRATCSVFFGDVDEAVIFNLASVLLEYSKGSFDQKILYQDKEFVRLHQLFRLRMVSRMNEMSKQALWAPHMLNDELRSLLKQPNQFLMRSCFYALADMTQHNISVADNTAGTLTWKHYCHAGPDQEVDNFNEHILVVHEPADTSECDLATNSNHFTALARSVSTMLHKSVPWISTAVHVRCYFKYYNPLVRLFVDAV
jgi:hypothetical protein